MTASSEPKVIALERAEGISGCFHPPSSAPTAHRRQRNFLPSSVGRRTRNIWPGATQPYSRFVPRHAVSQSIDLYTACEGVPQEADRRWVTSVCDTACLDQPQVWSIVGRGASRRAEAVSVCCRYPAGCSRVRWLRSRVGPCRCAMHMHMVSGDGGARPNVSLLRDDE
jgi:hypothetical protein